MNMNYFELMRTFVTYVIYNKMVLLNITNGFDFKFVISKNRL